MVSHGARERDAFVAQLLLELCGQISIPSA